MRVKGLRRAGFASAFVVGVAMCALIAPAGASAATCGTGTGGPYASNLCWFDMSAYNDALARSPAGQPMSITLPGGYTATFTLTSRPVAGAGVYPAIEPRATPLETRFAFGTAGYVGVPGRPSLYAFDAGLDNGVELKLSNITVVDSTNTPVTGYKFVIADTENTINGEGFNWTSDKPLDLIGVLNASAPRGCQKGLSGLGHDDGQLHRAGRRTAGSRQPRPWYDDVDRRCRHAIRDRHVHADVRALGGGLRDHDLEDPGDEERRRAGQRHRLVRRQGRRRPRDRRSRTASTGAGNSATTGELTVLPRTNGSGYTLSDLATPASGTRLADYWQSWSCTNNGVADASLPSGGGTSVSVFPEPGDDIECTVTNKAMPKPADLSIEKTADKAKAAPGEPVTYTFTAHNDGPAAAHHVTVRDPLSPYLQYVSGPPECTFANAELVCDFGTLAAGQTVSKNVVLRLDPAYTSASPPTADLIEVIKVEEFLSLQGGEYRQASLSCPDGYVMTDANPRVDSVDQGNDPADVHFVGSRTAPNNTAAGIASYDFDIENHTTGQAQVHLFGVCVALDTTGNDGHTLGTPLRQTGQINAPNLTGTTRVSRTLTCPNANDVAIAPGYVFQTGANFVHGPSLTSEQSPDGRSWTFEFQVAPKSAIQNDALIDVSIRCIPRTTSTDSGHQHALKFHHVYGRVTVGPHSTGEYRLSCPVGFKGIVETHDLPFGMKVLGTTPMPINRDFRLHNTTDEELDADLDLVCLESRVGDERNGGDVMNTASVHGDEPDWNAGNDFASFVLHDPPITDGDSSGGSGDGSDSGSVGADDGSGSGARPDDAPGSEKLGLRLGDRVTPAGKTALVNVSAGDEPSAGTVSIYRGDKKLGTGKFDLSAGEDAYVDVRLSKKGRKLMRRLTSVTVTVATGGETVERELRVAR